MLMAPLGVESPSIESKGVSREGEGSFLCLRKLEKLGEDMVEGKERSRGMGMGLLSDGRISVTTADVGKYEKASIGMTVMDGTPTPELTALLGKAGKGSGVGDSGDSAVVGNRGGETGKIVKSVFLGGDKASVLSPEYFASQKAIFTGDFEQEKPKKVNKNSVQGRRNSMTVPPGEATFEMLVRIGSPKSEDGQHDLESELFGELSEKKQVIKEKDELLIIKSNQQESTPLGHRLGPGFTEELGKPSPVKPLYGFDLGNTNKFFGISESDSLELVVNGQRRSSRDSGLCGDSRHGGFTGCELRNQSQLSKTQLIYKSPSQNLRNRITRSDKNIIRDNLLSWVEDAGTLRGKSILERQNSFPPNNGYTSLIRVESPRCVESLPSPPSDIGLRCHGAKLIDKA